MALCDICGETADRSAMETWSVARMKALVHSGFMPERLPPEMHRRARDPDEERLVLQSPDGSALEFDMRDPQSALKALWIMTVALADSDWAVCKRCQAEIRAHQGGAAPSTGPARQQGGGSGGLLAAALIVLALVVTAAFFFLLPGEEPVIAIEPATTERSVD